MEDVDASTESARRRKNFMKLIKDCEETDNKNIRLTNEQLVANGRFGRVYRAIMHSDDGSSRVVAVKKQNVNDAPSYLSERAVFKIFADLPTWYPSILHCIATQTIGDQFNIITDFHERLSLHELVSANVIGLRAAIRIIMTMLDGLQFLHDERPFYFGHQKPVIIHRDIKSKNILIRRDMTACIGDFGLARKFEYGRPKNADLLGQVGTRRYMSPEVLEGATEFTPVAFKQMDVYAMALVMWEVLSRTCVDGKPDQVPEYKLPYEKEVGKNPHIGLMRSIVVTRRLRPEFRDDICNHPKTRELKTITEEMWEPEAYGRITAGCAFDRVWKIAPEGSQNGLDESHATDKALLAYYADPENTPHPTPDPEHDPLMPTPPIIDFTTFEAPICEDQDARDLGYRDEKQEELIFDLNVNRYVSQEEAELLRKRRKNEDSTTTPEWSTSLFEF
ncbi:unnamed protein product [Caenorhabditis bovis]|nr:unnamed protein product [Caenorhabditis bovis]